MVAHKGDTFVYQMQLGCGAFWQSLCREYIQSR
jgi:hypothetical protein